MSSRLKKDGEHMFSIELESKKYLKRIALPNDVEDSILIEGFLGKLETVNIIEDVMLEIKGTNGILRMDLKEEALKKLRQCT